MNPVRPIWFYTYVLRSKKDSCFYTGTTNNLPLRLKQHSKGLVFSTKHKRPLQLIYFETCTNKNDAYPVRNFVLMVGKVGISNGAYRRERYLKSGMGKRYLRDRLTGGLTG